MKEVSEIMRHQIRRMLHKVTQSRLCGCRSQIIPVCCQVLPHQVPLILPYCTFLWTWLSCGGAAVRPVWSTSGRSEGRSTMQFWGKNPRPYQFDLQDRCYHLKYINLLLPTQSCVLYYFGFFNKHYWTDAIKHPNTFFNLHLMNL